MRLLLSGFEPFGGSPVNPSQRLVASLAAEPPSGVEIVAVTLPVVGGRAPRALRAAIHRHAPDAVLMLGESGAAAALALERVAVNLRDYPISDNSGRQVRDRPVIRDAPDALFATLPLRSMLSSILAAGVPATFSMSAGTFLCNEVMYAALHALRGSGTPGGFIHVPRLPEQVAIGPAGRVGPSMDEATAQAGLVAAIGAIRRGVSRRA